MTKYLISSCFTLMLASISSIALAECDGPAAPIIPDGNVASMDELVAAQKAMKMYQESLVGYRECLGEEEAALDPEAEDHAASAAAVLAQYNASVESEEAVAAEFNTAVRAYKERQPAESE